jgi:hypothetical protein
MSEKTISSALMQQWEQEAIAQKIPYTEFGEFLRMKERNYRLNLSTKNRVKVFASGAQNKFTESGNKIAYEKIMQIPAAERAVKIAKFSFEELRKKSLRGFCDEQQKENFLSEREYWFSHLKERMRDLKLSKEFLADFGLDWKECKKFAFSAV